ncbi:unnamed protein product, partial [Rotaria magnacalcarata]
LDEPNHEVVTTASTETSTNENVPEEIKPEEKTEILDSSPNTKELENQSKEPSSERQFQDAEKA